EAVGCESCADHVGPDLPDRFLSWGPLQRGQYLESTLFLSQYLLSSQGDRMAMAHSVESRMPFLDYRLVEFCNHLPSALKLQGLNDKRLLRQLGREFLPPEIWQRPKRAYRAPIYKSFVGQPGAEYVRELLAPEKIQSAGLFNPTAVTNLVNKIQSGFQI